MYEKMRNELIENLCFMPKAEMLKVLDVVDRISANYEITEKSTELALYEDHNAQIIQTFIACKKLEDMSAGGIQNYSYTLRAFFMIVRKNLENVEVNDVRMFLAQYPQDHSISNRSLDKIRQRLFAFFKWCQEEGYIDKNPCATIKPIKFEVIERKFLTADELLNIRDACQTLREKALIEFLFSTGCRIAEAASCQLSDINFDSREVLVIGKGKKQRRVYLNPAAKKALIRYLDSRHDDCPYLFVSLREPRSVTPDALREEYERVAQRAGIKSTPHEMRHTTATKMVSSGASLQEVQMLLGHEQITTTTIYAKTSQEAVKNSCLKYIS